jgi:hypothetical protein
MTEAQLLASWRDNDLGLAEFLGSALSNIPTLTDPFCQSFGQALFHKLRMCERIDFLYAKIHHRNKDKKEFQNTVNFGYRDGIAFIEDKIGDFGHIALMMLRDLDPPNHVYAVRLYADGTGCPPFLLSVWTDKPPTFENVAGHPQHVIHRGLINGDTEDDYEHVCDHDETFWNFTCKKDGLIIWEHSEGFMDLRMTRRIAKLIQWTSNILGFQG